MPYSVTYTESNNPAKPAITVADGSLNNQTSLTFVGQGYNGFAPEIAKDLLHLLENFSNSSEPAHPVEGQIYFNNVDKVLYVYDGTTWSPSGSLRKAISAPVNAVAGDLWTNTITSQLYVYSGSNWLLVGPQYSDGTKTGPIVDEIIDINNTTHSVISLYANNSLISIVSNESFIPKSTITGFPVVKKGLNVYSTKITPDPGSDYTAFWGTASSADALLIGGKAIAASNFLRGNDASTTNYPISIKSDAGLNVGSTLSFNIGVNGNSTLLTSNGNGNSVDFRLNNGGTLSTLLHLSAANRVGIGQNNTSPASELDVSGLITASSGLNVTGTTDSSALGVGSIKTAGGLSVALKSNFGGDVKVAGKLYVTTGNGTAAILPTATSQYDIGSSNYKFRNVYADTFVGSFNGAVTGTLTGAVHGSADSLASATRFYLSGDVSSPTLNFDGQGDDPMNFVTSISTNFITGKDAATDSAWTDEFLVYRPGTTSLLKMTKKIFLNHVATVPTGAIMPFAGTKVPAGYLLCDGSEVEVSLYPDLYAVIGLTYRAQSLLQGLNTFALPDLRGRFPLGRDSMNNNISVPYKDGSGTPVTTVGAAANRVTDSVADTIGLGTGSETASLVLENLPDHKHNLRSSVSQYYAGGVAGDSPTGAVPGLGLPASSAGAGLPNSGSVISSNPLGKEFNIMNPYATINYIIFTGVIS